MIKPRVLYNDLGLILLRISHRMTGDAVCNAFFQGKNQSAGLKLRVRVAVLCIPRCEIGAVIQPALINFGNGGVQADIILRKVGLIDLLLG